MQVLRREKHGQRRPKHGLSPVIAGAVGYAIGYWEGYRRGFGRATTKAIAAAIAIGGRFYG